MTGWEWVLLFLAGVGGGLTGSIAGLASVCTYPALLAVGLPPVTANVTNTVALVLNAVGSIWGSLPELRGQGRKLARLVPAGVLGGALGAALLLSMSSEGFERIVPVLLAGSAVAIALPQRKRAEGASHGTTMRVLEGLAVLAISVYGGFFGAAAGVLMLALFLRTDSESLADANATKNVVLGLANAVAAVAFVAWMPVPWSAVLPLGLGCLIGGRVGPVLVRHAPATPLRITIAIAGVALAGKLGFDAYR